MMKTGKLLDLNDFDANIELLELIPGLPTLGIMSELMIDEKSGVFSVYKSLDGKTGFADISGSINIDSSLVELSTFVLDSFSMHHANQVVFYQISLKSVQYSIMWQWQIAKSLHDVFITASLVNIGEKSLTISDWTVFKAESNRRKSVFTQHLEDSSIFQWNSWNMGVERLAYNGETYSSENILHLYDPIDQTALLCGFITLSRMQARHEIKTSKTEGSMDYRAKCQFGSFKLLPAGRYNSEILAIGFHNDPYAMLENWADQMKHIYQPKLNVLPPVGWCGGSWASTRSTKRESWEEYTIENARAIRTRLAGFSVDYLWTSQSNLKDYIPGNWLNVNEREIPSGLENYFDKLMKLGFKPGLWVSPFWFYGEAEGMFDENQGNLLKDSSGVPICREEVWGWQYDDDLPWYHMHRYFLDGTHPKTIDYIQKLFAYYQQIGVRYYMLDFLGIVAGSQLYDQTKTSHQAGYSILKEIRETSGSDTHIQTAVSSSPGFSGTISAARIGRDFGEGRPLEGGSLSDWRNATHVLHDLHYANTKYFLKNIAANYFTHQKLYMNDLNLMTVDKPYPVDHARIVATLFGLNGGSPLMLGDDFLRLDEERLRMIKLCLPRTHHSARPVDLFDRVQPDDYSRILKLEIKTEWDSYMVVGAFNMDDQPYSMKLDFAKLGLTESEKYVLYDFWNEEYCGIFRTSYPCIIPANSCKLYRISKARSHPWLISTDMHIQQGFVEVCNLQWNDEEATLSGCVTRPVGEKGNLFILIPKEYKVIDTHGISLVKELFDFNIIGRLPVNFQHDCESFELKFDRWQLHMLAPKGLIPYSTKDEWLTYMKDHYKKEATRVFE